MTLSDSSEDIRALRNQLGAAWNRFNTTEQAQQVQMLQSIQRLDDVALHTQSLGDGRWKVTVCTSDCIGALPSIAGLLAAYGLNIVTGDVFSLSHPEPEREKRAIERRRRTSRRGVKLTSARPSLKILDIFLVQAVESVALHTWESFKADLGNLMSLLVRGEQQQAREQVIERVSGAARPAGNLPFQLFPVDIEVSNDASPDSTQLTIHSIDTHGFLFAFTNALSVLDMNIVRGEIRTVGGEVKDTFFLTDRAGCSITSPGRLLELRAVAVLIKHFTYLLPRCPNPAQAFHQFNALTRQMLTRNDWTQEFRELESTQVLETVAELMGVSRFLWDDFLRMQHENLFPVLLNTPSLEEPKELVSLRSSLQQQLTNTVDLNDQVQELNKFKDREMFRIDLRHITRRVGFRQFSEELSDLAQVVVEAAAGICHKEVELRFGRPTLGNGQPCSWCIFALGKFGGRELGFGSDIELIIVYREEGTTDSSHPIENSRYFGEFVRSLLAALETKREGIFEIDLRLRPYGNAGSLACSLEGFREYYSQSGRARQFERMALVKLRPVAGDLELGTEVLRARDEFVYSGQPLDVENILHLRQRQATELVPQGAISAKHSPGGLVDVEYFVQACQIAVGHRDPELRVCSTLETIDLLRTKGYVSEALAQNLQEVYGFLRRLIDALRVVRGNARDLTIPGSDCKEFAYLSRRLQYPSPGRLQDAISELMGQAGRLWDEKIPPGEGYR